MTRNKYFPTLIFGFGAAVLSNVPGLNTFSCCIIIPAAVYMALYVDQRLNHFGYKVIGSNAFAFGILTGVFAALFTSGIDAFITFITKSNPIVYAVPQMREMVGELNLGPVGEASLELIEQMSVEIKQNGFSAIYSSLILITNLIYFSVFGIIGGFVAMAIVNNRYHKNHQNTDNSDQ